MRNKTDQHRAFVRRLKKNPEHIMKMWQNDLSMEDAPDLMHAALGIAGEAGEVVDMIKKHVINGHDLNNGKLVEEIGDLMFYVHMALMHTGTTLEECLDFNMAKLQTRFPDGYTDSASKDRVDVHDAKLGAEMIRSQVTVCGVSRCNEPAPVGQMYCSQCIVNAAADRAWRKAHEA